MKRILTILFLLTIISLSAGAVKFSDINENSWYGAYVEAVCDKGIIKGVGNDKFDPDGMFSVSQCLAVACRLHSQSTGNEISENAVGSWYMPYVNYCLENGIISEGEFDSYTRSITREETARVLTKAVPADMLSAINDICGIADVARDDDEFLAILSLYNAGILSGSDKAGSFMPKSYIKRSEMSAVIARITDENLRIKASLPYYGDARYLIDDSIMRGPNNGIMSAWRLDDKYQLGNTTGADSNTVSADFGQKNALYRPINSVYEGNVRFDIIVTMTMVENGAYVSVDDKENLSVISIRAADSELIIASGDSITKTGILIESTSEHCFTFDMDLNKGSADITIDGKTFFGILIEKRELSRLSVGFDGSGRGIVSVDNARCVADYRVNENFIGTEKNENTSLYGHWKSTGNVTMNRILSERGEDVYSARMSGASTAGIGFDVIGGKICVEANILIPDKSTSVILSINSGESTVADISAIDGKFCCNSDFLRNVAENVWTNIRLEIDLPHHSVFIRINGKDCGVHRVSDKFYAIDNLCISTGEEKVIWFDDIKVFSLYDRDDYVTEPNAVNDDGYKIGVNVCNLWRNGNCGEGYDAVAPFDELYPYVGLADEGLPELSDIEIKQMAEHGIDFQHICWYSPQNVTNVPIKGTLVPQIALNDGYLKSKYGKYVSFCIMWENSNGSVENLEQFKDYLWPYFKEYYFSDERYYSIDNKAVMTIWDRDKLISSFGGVSGAREAVEFMKEDIKTLGYDGLIILFSGDTSVLSIIEDLGGDGLYAYNFSRSGEHADYQIGTMQNNKSYGDVYYVPSVSVGFNAIGRHDERSGMITPDEHKRVCEYIRDEYIPSENNGSWHDNLLLVSTWNEYTEGTYVAPNNLYGFKYLDNIREVFTDAENEHVDEMPSEKTKDRLRNIYPDGYSPIRRYRLEGASDGLDISSTKPVISWDFSDTSAQQSWQDGHGLNSFGFRDGVLYGGSGANDFSFCTPYRGPLSIDVDKTGARCLHIRMKSDVISRGEMFFTTNTIPSYIEEAKVSWDITSIDSFTDYYIDVSQNKLWNGIITGLRIDPMATPGKFEVELIELLYDTTVTKTDICFDGTKMDFDFEPEYNEKLSDYMVTLNPRLGFFTMSHTYYEYDIDKNTFLIESLSGSIMFTVGSDKAIINGSRKNLGYTFTLRDGLPYVAVKSLMKALGFGCKESGNVLEFTTLDTSALKILSQRREAEWTFEHFGDKEGFTFQNCKGNVYDGFFNLEATGRDTAIKNMNLDIPLTGYTKVTVGIKYKTDTANPVIQVFFLTSVMNEMNEAASARVSLEKSDTNGEITEVVFDLSDNPDWLGTLHGLRIDPYHGMGTYSIDYIRLS